MVSPLAFQASRRGSIPRASAVESTVVMVLRLVLKTRGRESVGVRLLYSPLWGGGRVAYGCRLLTDRG